MNSIKLKSYLGDNVTDFCALILVDGDNIESSGAFYLEHLGYIAQIFEDNSVSRFHLWAIQKYKEVTGFIRNIHVCDLDVMQFEELITYESLVKEAMREYHNLANYKWWEPASGKEKYQYEPSILKE